MKTALYAMYVLTISRNLQSREAVVLRNVFNLSAGGEEPSTRSNSIDVIEAVENPYSSLPFGISKQGMYR